MTTYRFGGKRNKGQAKAHSLLNPKQEVNRKRSQKQERRLASDLNMRTTPNSGATPWASQKGDLQSSEHVVEAKTTKADRFTITHDLLIKITQEARRTGRQPVVLITLETMPNPIPKDWALVPLDGVKSHLRCSTED